MNFSVEGARLVSNAAVESSEREPKVKNLEAAETAELPEAVRKAIRVELRNSLDSLAEPTDVSGVYSALKESKILYRYGLINARPETKEQGEQNAKGEKAVMGAIEKERQAMIAEKRGKKSVN